LARVTLKVSPPQINSNPKRFPTPALFMSWYLELFTWGSFLIWITSSSRPPLICVIRLSCPPQLESLFFDLGSSQPITGFAPRSLDRRPLLCRVDISLVLLCCCGRIRLPPPVAFFWVIPSVMCSWFVHSASSSAPLVLSLTSPPCVVLRSVRFPFEIHETSVSLTPFRFFGHNNVCWLISCPASFFP